MTVAVTPPIRSQLELRLKAFTPHMIWANILCVGNIFSDSPTLNAVLHINCVISHDKFNAATEAFIFSAQAHVNKQIRPIRPLHLTTNAIVAQNAHQC